MSPPGQHTSMETSHQHSPHRRPCSVPVPAERAQHLRFGLPPKQCRSHFAAVVHEGHRQAFVPSSPCHAATCCGRHRGGRGFGRGSGAPGRRRRAARCGRDCPTHEGLQRTAVTIEQLRHHPRGMQPAEVSLHRRLLREHEGDPLHAGLTSNSLLRPEYTEHELQSQQSLLQQPRCGSRIALATSATPAPRSPHHHRKTKSHRQLH
mmetsp:Transcript_32105/g.68737  ORF Transcript_32105/g.68737 Transcript_32105/m.68737 type:complete len:206 (-) Transcript_32105:639-1256(-)